MMYCRDLGPRHLIDIRAHANLPQPAAVVWPKNTDELAALTEVAGRQGVPLAAAGGGAGSVGPISRNLWRHRRRNERDAADPARERLCRPRAALLRASRSEPFRG